MPGLIAFLLLGSAYLGGVEMFGSPPSFVNAAAGSISCVLALMFNDWWRYR